MFFDVPKATIVNTRVELLDVREACQMLGIGRTTFYNFINTGRLKGIKLSRRKTKIMRLEIDRFISEAALNKLLTPTMRRSISQNTPQD